jgi:hypothetical protein
MMIGMFGIPQEEVAPDSRPAGLKIGFMSICLKLSICDRILICHPGQAQREPGPIWSVGNAAMPHGSRHAPLRGLAGMTVREGKEKGLHLAVQPFEHSNFDRRWVD